MKSDIQSNIDHKALQNTLLSWLKRRLDDKAYTWIKSTNDTILAGGENWEFFSAFSLVPRHTGKDDLNLTGKEEKEAESQRKGWEPTHWTVDELGRTLIVLSLANREKKEFLDNLEKLFISSDMGEAVALYQSLPVLPWPEELKGRAAEGIRSNITTVFNVIAHRNPYPSEYLDDLAWNQLVLKALFVGSPLWPIRGIDRRANSELARMLVEYAHERWAAGRSMSPELWRPVGPYLTEEMLVDMEKLLEHPEDIQKQATVLALSSSRLPGAEELLKKQSDLVDIVSKSGVNWEDIGKRYSNNN